MVMSWIFTAILSACVICSIITGSAEGLAAAVLDGARSGVDLAVCMAGSVCLWCGVGNLMENNGMSGWLSRLLKPVLRRLFPTSRQDAQLAGDLSANICANILGLGNAATPMGIRATRRLATSDKANDELCRLVVLNTASIQLIPANVAAVRAGLGCSAPFDILPAVWLTSVCSAGAGLLAAWLLARVWHD